MQPSLPTASHVRSSQKQTCSRPHSASPPSIFFSFPASPSLTKVQQLCLYQCLVGLGWSGGGTNSARGCVPQTTSPQRPSRTGAALPRSPSPASRCTLLRHDRQHARQIRPAGEYLTGFNPSPRPEIVSPAINCASEAQLPTAQWKR